ncbi:DUF1642 domain-containing protein [Carnobacterium maltaromaticum]|uniref:DUF1642 domain-containing protein n=1 Tax=Carnobacterium maltaromaticum TaxID=2751 RepID=UPI0039B120C5
MTNKLEEVFKELQESHVLVEKVKVPKFIADWIETWKGDGRTILHAMTAAEGEVSFNNNPVGKWLTGGRITEHDIKNQMIFVSAWLNGYEVEEEKAKFEVGEYYTIGLDISSREIFMVISAEDKLKAKSYRVSYDHFRIMCTDLKGNSFVVTDSKLATDEEIKLFKRAEMYHKHGRKLDELKSGDFVHYVNGNGERTSSPRMPYDNVLTWIETIQRGNGAIYLTAEEHQESHKKIVGE